MAIQKITAAQFKTAVGLDPAWASKLTEPVKITDYCDMEGSKITHLSPLLHFSGRDRCGWSANFWSCESLKIAEGKFDGFAWFNDSGIQKIGDLSCGRDNNGNSANFSRCKYLKVAKGNFEGFVGFYHSGIEKIRDLSCGKNDGGDSASFDGCKSLKVAEGEFDGFVVFSESGIEKIGNLTCGKNEHGLSFAVKECPNLSKIPISFDPTEIEADPRLIEKLEVDRFIRKRRAEIVEVEL